MKYTVIARKKDGSKVQGDYEAVNQGELIANLKHEGLMVLRVTEAAPAAGAASAQQGAKAGAGGRQPQKKSDLPAIVLLILLTLVALVIGAYYWGVPGFKDGPVANVIESVPGLKRAEKPSATKPAKASPKKNGDAGKVNINFSR